MSEPLGAFNASLDQWISQLKDYLDEVVRNVTFEIAENIIVGGEFAPGTPIDTGFARASWWIAVNDMGSPHQAPDNPGKLLFAVAPSTLAAGAQAKAGDIIYILSNTLYMPVLEFGHSDQAPQGMIRLTLTAGQRIVDKVARQMGAV